MTRNIERRLGIIIGIYRKRKVKQGISNFKQTQFIKTEIKHPFEGVSLDSNVCSLATLSRLENGKHQHNYDLIEYFLKKLEIQYRIKESTYKIEKFRLKSITLAFAYSPVCKLTDLLMSCDKFYLENQDDVLLKLDHQAFKFMSKLVLLKRPDRIEYENLLEIYDAVDPYLQEWITESGFWLKHTHPDFWNLKVRHEKTKLFSHLKIHHLRLNKENGSSIIKTSPHFNRFHDSSWAMQELNIIMGQKEQCLVSPNILSEMTHCLEIVQHNSFTIKGHSKLFHALHTYIHMSSSEKIKYLSDHLIELLTHEPYPKPITKIISQNALILCQSQRSYKPLIRLLELHLENNQQNSALSSVFQLYVNADHLS